MTRLFTVKNIDDGTDMTLDVCRLVYVRHHDDVCSMKVEYEDERIHITKEDYDKILKIWKP